jgi:excinuclease ABC subunit C
LVRQDYKKNIHNIIRVLEGKSQVVLKELQKEMEKSSKLEKFEDALKYKAQIDALSVITQPSHTPFEYDINPNLRTDIRDSEIDMLIQALSNAGLHVSGLQRIECYDISNISGTHATGSLVVLSDGEIDKSQYRKFKIKKDGSPNDFAMMKEMLERRLKHDEWPCPSLIVIDGGKGQLSSVLEAMYLTQKYFPVVGLAKREETIIVPVHQPFFNPASKNLIEVTESNYKKLYGDNEENFVEISLPKDSGSLHLIQRIRNEAHRFAITYHRGLRSKGARKE